MFEQYVIRFVETGADKYLFNHRMSVVCKCYARVFTSEKRAKVYFRQSNFAHCPFDIVKK